MKFDKPFQIIYLILFVFFMFYKHAVCVLMLGLICLYYAIKGFILLNNLNKNGIDSFGTIITYESDEKGYKTPIIEFQTLDGKFFMGKPSVHVSSDLDKFQSYKENINKKIKIRYSSEDPEKFMLKDNSGGFGLILLIIVGSIFTYISIGNLMGYNQIF